MFMPYYTKINLKNSEEFMKVIWKDKTYSFTEKQRHFKNKYLEICNVFDERVEVNLYSSDEEYEIYVNYGKMFGISYVSEEEAYERFEMIKEDIEKEIEKNGFDPSRDFVNEFCEKYQITIPNDIFFDFKF